MTNNNIDTCVELGNGILWVQVFCRYIHFQKSSAGQYYFKNQDPVECFSTIWKSSTVISRL